MVETVQSEEGYITMEDMIEYHVRSPEPASTLYKRYHVLTSGAEWGGAELVEKLNLMELAGIGSSTDSYLTNATKLFWLASITRVSSFISFFTHIVPDGKHLLKEHLGVDVDGSDRTTKEAADELWDKFGSVENMKDINELMREMVASVEMDMEYYRHGSSGVVAVDRSGNVCSLVHGTDSGLWGSGLFVQGVSLPSSGIALKSVLKGTRSGDRVPSGLQPLIVFKEEFPELNQLGRRIRRDVHLTTKHRRRPTNKRKSLKHHGYTVKDVPQKLVVFKTHNRARSHLQEEPFTESSQWEKPTQAGMKQLERLVKLAKVDENNKEEEEDREYGRLDQEREKIDNEVSIPVQRESPTPTTEKLPTDPEPYLEPLKPVPRKPSSKNEKPVVTSNNVNGEEGEGEGNGIEEEQTLNNGTDGKEETQKEEPIKEDELLGSREFPHLGIPDAWEPNVYPEERGEPAFHTGLVPVLAMTCLGPSHQLAIPQYLTNILDSEMNPKAALEAPTFLAPSPRSFQQDVQVEKFAIAENILQEVGEFGQAFTEVDSQTAEDVAGIGAAVTLNSDWKMLGCVHPSKEGLAEGVSVLKG